MICGNCGEVMEMYADVDGHIFYRCSCGNEVH